MANEERRHGRVPSTGLYASPAGCAGGWPALAEFTALALYAFAGRLTSINPFWMSSLIGRCTPQVRNKCCDPIVLDCWTLIVSLDRHPQLCRNAWHLPRFGGCKFGGCNGCNLTTGTWTIKTRSEKLPVRYGIFRYSTGNKISSTTVSLSRRCT